MTRPRIDELVRILNRSFSDSEHSLLKNLASVTEEEWDALPQGARRSIRSMVARGKVILPFLRLVVSDRSPRSAADSVRRDFFYTPPGILNKTPLQWAVLAVLMAAAVASWTIFTLGLIGAI